MTNVGEGIANCASDGPLSTGLECVRTEGRADRDEAAAPVGGVSLRQDRSRAATSMTDVPGYEICSAVASCPAETRGSPGVAVAEIAISRRALFASGSFRAPG